MSVAAESRPDRAADAKRVPPGYKRTEVGVIPADWETSPLVDLCPPQGLVRGPFGGALKKTEFVASGYKVYEQQNAINANWEIGTYYIPRPKFDEMKRFQVRPGDFVVSCSGTIGRVYQIPCGAAQGVINQALLKITTDERAVDSEFFRQVFGSDEFQARIIDNTQGGAMHNLVGMRVFKRTLLIRPPLPEQRAIAAALSDVDGLIAALDRLIAKKRAIKQAAMQELLTGRTRLPGFTGKWETRRLGELADVDPENLPASTDSCYRFNYISLEQVDRGVLTGYSEEVFASAPSRARRVLRFGDVLVSTVRPNLQSHLLFVRQVDNAVCSTGFAVLRCKSSCAEPSYVFSQLFSDGFGRAVERILAGSNYPAISSADVKSIEIPCPPLTEQRAIASVLSDMDAEIAALERRREKTRTIKQGMMQELLTGRVRLPVEDAG